MAVDPKLLALALERRETVERLLGDLDDARAGFARAVQHLFVDGATLREIAEALGLSHQRVHQLVHEARPVEAGESAPHGWHCAFCGRAQADVEKLVVGPGVAICDRCGTGAADAADRSPRPRTSCSFCGKRGRQVAWLASNASDDTRICDECCDLIGQILAETDD